MRYIVTIKITRRGFIEALRSSDTADESEILNIQFESVPGKDQENKLKAVLEKIQLKNNNSLFQNLSAFYSVDTLARQLCCVEFKETVLRIIAASTISFMLTRIEMDEILPSTEPVALTEDKYLPTQTSDPDTDWINSLVYVSTSGSILLGTFVKREGACVLLHNIYERGRETLHPVAWIHYSTMRLATENEVKTWTRKHLSILA